MSVGYKYLSFVILTVVLSCACLYGQYYNVTGKLISVPDNDCIKGKITLQDMANGKKYTSAIDNTTGSFLISIPTGTYQRTIEAINHYFFLDTLSIKTDTTLNKEIVKYLVVNSTNYQGYNKPFLLLFKDMTNTWRNQPGQVIHRWAPTNGDTTVIPVFPRRYDPNDSISMPAEWATAYDSCVDYLGTCEIKDKIRFEEKITNDSVHNIHYSWSNNNQMPIPGSYGYTIRGPADAQYIGNSGIWMNRQFLYTAGIRITNLREIVRSLGLESNSIDPTSVMWVNGNGNRVLSSDDINILRTLFSLTPATDMFPYKDSVITYVNFPPDKPLLVGPKNYDTLRTGIQSFAWNKSTDAENDTISYAVRIYNEQKDTTISGLSDTTLTIKNVLQMLGAQKYYHWSVQANDGINCTYSNANIFYTGILSSTGKQLYNHLIYALNQNYPNPFNPSTIINYSLPISTRVQLSIYNQLGEKIAILQDGEKEAGNYSVKWDAVHMASGIYFYELRTEKYHAVKKLLLVK